MFSFGYRFELPEATKDLRSKQPFKIVHKEYLITTAMTLIGNVGGTLGMFIGFSFIGVYGWFVDITKIIWKWVEMCHP